MASFNRITLIGRLTRDVETKTFANGGKVAKFGFAVDGERKKNQQSGKWESQPCFLDCEVFNRGENGKSADLVEQYCSKGKPLFIEGHLKQENWVSQDGSKRSKLVVVVDNFQLLENKPREDYQPQANASPGHADTGPKFAPDGAVEDLPF